MCKPLGFASLGSGPKIPLKSKLGIGAGLVFCYAFMFGMMIWGPIFDEQTTEPAVEWHSMSYCHDCGTESLEWFVVPGGLRPRCALCTKSKGGGRKVPGRRVDE